MPGDSETAKPEKRDREEAQPVPAAVVAGTADVPAPAAKKLKPDDAAVTETPAVAAADTGAPAVADAADADAAAPAEPAKAAAVAASPSPMEEEEGEEKKEEGKKEEGKKEEKKEEEKKEEEEKGEEVKGVEVKVEVKLKAEEKGEEVKVEVKVSEQRSEDKVKEAETAALKMLEFYFGDSNFGWDRFMQNKAGKMGENLMDISVLMTFNKLKNIVKKADLSPEEGLALIARMGEASPSLRVSEDKKQIGRAAAMTEEAGEERIARTVQTKGYPKESSIKIEDVEKLFSDAGKANYVKICKAGGNKLTSIFVEFDKKEAADKAVARSEDYFYEGEPIAVRPAKSDEERAAAHAAPAPEPIVFEAGKIIHIAGIPESGVSRESLKNAVESFGTALYVDFSFGGREAWIRRNPAEAAATVASAKETDGLTLAAEVEEKGTVSLLEGADEKDYYDRMEKMRAERLNRGRGRGRGRGKGRGRGGRGGGGRGRGRGRGGGGGDGGGD
ncbi:unnamed protein product [Ectocarpus sp. 12 AP-2014]